MKCPPILIADTKDLIADTKDLIADTKDFCFKNAFAVLFLSIKKDLTF